jgi:hypothetical protein
MQVRDPPRSLPPGVTRFFAEFILSQNDEILHFVQNDKRRAQNDKVMGSG